MTAAGLAAAANHPEDLRTAAIAALEHAVALGRDRYAPSVLAAVYDAHGVIAVRSRGHHRLDEATPTPGTVYRIASMSKSFLVAAALRARDDGLLDLDVPIRRYLPEARSIRFAGRTADVTARMLLSNRSGLPEDNAWGDRHLPATREEIRAVVEAGLRLTAPPDTAYQYSNLAFTLVGRALEVVTDMPIEEYVTERLLRPLGLDRTVYDRRELPGADLAPGWRTFDRGRTWTPEPYLEPGALGCIGGLFSTVGDIARWAEFLRAGYVANAAGAGGIGETNTDADETVGADAGTEALDPYAHVLSARSRAEMQTMHSPIHTTAGQNARGLVNAGYGMGLEIDQHRRFGVEAGHTGGLPGFSSHMRWQLATGIGVVVFANRDEFPARNTAAELLDDVLAAAGAPAARIRPWAETIAAARQLDAALQAGRGVADSGAPFAGNVFADIPAAVRDRRLRALTRSLGGVRSEAEDAVPGPAGFERRIVSARTAAEVQWIVPCARGDIICGVRMMATEPPVVEGLWASRANGDGRRATGDAARMTDWFAPEL
ncbi:MAG: serine hydrolase domain-containing protein [Pseudoclavibacter sp.]